MRTAQRASSCEEKGGLSVAMLARLTASIW